MRIIFPSGTRIDIALGLMVGLSLGCAAAFVVWMVRG